MLLVEFKDRENHDLKNKTIKKNLYLVENCIILHQKNNYIDHCFFKKYMYNYIKSCYKGE